MELTETTEDAPKQVADLKPFLKIPGGKRKLLPDILAHFPKDFFENRYNYVEPMLGGGAVALEVVSRYNKLEGERPIIALNDFNSHISNLWNSVIQHPERVLNELSVHLKHHDKSYYYLIRECLPKLSDDQVSDWYKAAADFLYLDKNCYNGLIRFNKSGEFNSPIGSYSKVQGVDSSNVLNIGKTLNPMYVCSVDFQKFFEDQLKAKRETLFNPNTLVYFDPPYVPLSATSNFTNYNSNGFTEYDQIRLKMIIDVLTKLDVKVILSNSAAEWVYDTYSEYNIFEIKAARSINSAKNKRGKIKELLITNFTN